MPIARLARATDLPFLLALFDVSEVSAVAQPRERAESIWQETLAHPGVHVFVSGDRDRIAASCMLVIAPNLLRGGGGTGSWRTSSLTLSYEGEVMARLWYRLRWDMHGRLTATTC